MRKISRIGLSVFLTLGLFGGIVSAEPITNDEIAVISTVNKAYQAAINLDAGTFTGVTIDLSMNSEEKQLQQMTKVYDIVREGKRNKNSEADYLISFEIGEITKISDTEYSVYMTQTFSKSGVNPSYNIPVVKKEGQWIVVLENIVVIDKRNPEAVAYIDEMIRLSAIRSANPVLTVEKLADNKEIAIYKESYKNQ
ncbi:hypothetical protein M3231_03565 [Neobacillus mesonae]|nr:hypothetical protein [Neobacillus mesonae]